MFHTKGLRERSRKQGNRGSKQDLKKTCSKKIINIASLRKHKALKRSASSLKHSLVNWDLPVPEAPSEHV